MNVCALASSVIAQRSKAAPAASVVLDRMMSIDSPLVGANGCPALDAGLAQPPPGP